MQRSMYRSNELSILEEKIKIIIEFKIWLDPLNYPDVNML